MAAELGWGMYSVAAKLALAGYNIGDVISARWSNSYYHTLIGIQILTIIAGQIGNALASLEIANAVAMALRLKFVINYVVSN